MLSFNARAAAVLYTVTAAVLTGCIGFAPAAQPDKFFTEKQTINTFSAALLFTCCLLSALNWLVGRDLVKLDGVVGRLGPFWRLAVAGFAFLTVDEYFAVHEGIDDGLLRLAGLKAGNAPVQLDTVLLVGYGIVGLYLLGRYRADLRQISGFFSFLGVGAVFAVVSLYFDLGIEKVPEIYFEDGAKLFANTSFVLACLSAACASWTAARAHQLTATLDGPEGSP
jgi:hypothetical protein